MKPFVLVLFGFSILTQIVVSAADWQKTDIGAVAAPGSATTDDRGGFVVQGSGEDIWNTSDEFHFVYLPAQGDLEILGRVLSVQNMDPWAKAGLMIRESVAANSKNAMVFLTPANQSGLQWRSVSGGSSSYTAGGSVPLPYWIRLVRTNDTFTAYRSANGTAWTLIGSTTISMAKSVYVGLAVTSHRDGTLAEARYDNVALSASSGSSTNSPPSGGTNAPPAGGTNSPAGAPAAPSDLRVTTVAPDRIDLTWVDNATNEVAMVVDRSTNGADFKTIDINETGIPGQTDSTVSPGTHYWYRIAATNNAGISPWSNIPEATTPSFDGALPPPWRDQDIGVPQGSGGASFSQGHFQVRGSGADIYGSSDQFHYVFQPGTNDVTIIAEVDRMDPTNPWARAGLMFRETLNANAKNATVFLTPGHGVGFTWRDTTGGQTQYAPGPDFERGPTFLKLSRSGTTFSAYWSADDHNWILIGSASINMASAYQVGLAVSSHAVGVVCNAEFEQVGVTGSGTGGSTNPPSGAPPAKTSQDIGAVGVAGSTTQDQGTFTVKGSGSDIWNSADAFQFAYQTVSGNGEFVARVTSIQNTSPWAKAGVMFRQSTAANAPNVFMMISPTQGTGFQVRTAQGTATTYVLGPAVTVLIWLKVRRKGDLFTAYTSSD